MCYKGKCLMCIPVENGCLVLAILSAIVTCFALLACLIMGVLTGAGVIFAATQARKHKYDWGGLVDEPTDSEVAAAVLIGGIAAGIVIFIIGIASLIAFIFSVLLCNGICKRRPGQVKAYFIYGVTITVLGVLAAIGYLIKNNSCGMEPGIYTLLACAIYSLYLVLVHQTYSKLLEGAIFKDHIRLVES